MVIEETLIRIFHTFHNTDIFMLKINIRRSMPQADEWK